MGSVFTGRTGLPRRTKVLLLLLLLVLAGALVVVFLRSAQDPRRRLATGETTTSDEAAFREDPEAWINLVGGVMVEQAEAANYDRLRSLSRFLLRMVEGLSVETEQQFGELVVWIHATSASAVSEAPVLVSWIQEIGADTPLRLRILCRAFESAGPQVARGSLSLAIASELVVGVTDEPMLRDEVASNCRQVLAEGLRTLALQDDAEALAAYARRVLNLIGPGIFESQLAEAAMTLRGLSVIVRAVRDEIEAHTVPDAGEPAEAAERLLVWRDEVLVPELVQALDETPGASPELWEVVDDEGTLRAVTLLGEVEEAMGPLAWFALVDRLAAAAPEGQRASLRSLREGAQAGARAVVREALSPVIETCRQLAAAPVELTISFEASQAPSLRGNSQGPLRVCVEEGLRALALDEADELTRPLTVPITLSNQPQSSDSTND